MSSGADRAEGHRLAVLRSLFGLTQGALASKLGVTQPFLSQLERGQRPVPLSLALAAAEAYQLPITFFQAGTSARRNVTPTFRKTAAASSASEARVVALFDEAARIFHQISQQSGYRTASLPTSADVGDDPEIAATEVRRTLGLSSAEPLMNVTRSLERLGVGVIDQLDHLPDAERGHTAISKPSTFEDRPLVAILGEVPPAVKRLTLAHELGHLIHDNDLLAPVAGIRSIEEKRAYRFAGAFLLPADVIRTRVSESLNLHGYLPIKADFGVSVGAIVMRAQDLGVISARRARSLHIQISSRSWRHDEPVEVADEIPLLFQQALRKVFGSHAYSKGAYALGTRAEWLRQWARGNTDDDPDAEMGAVVDFAAARRRRAH